MKAKKRSLKSDYDKLHSMWYVSYTQERIRNYAKHILDNYDMPDQLRATIIAFLMGLPIEYVSTDSGLVHSTTDPQWHHADSILRFRIRGSGNEPSN